MFSPRRYDVKREIKHESKYEDTYMKILFFRHGIAHDQSPDGSDAGRTLTDEGVKKTTEAAHGLAAITDPPDVILTSPKARAMQTANIVGKVFNRKPVTADVLAEQAIEPILKMLATREEDTVMLVGHEPTFSALIETLCTGREPHGCIDLKKAGSACVDCPNSENLTGTGVLLWLATPRMLRASAP